MGTMVPIELIRLRSATAAFVAILRDGLPLIEALAKREELRETPMAELREGIQAALEMEDVPGTPVATLNTLAALLGETHPSGRPPRARSARGGVLPHGGASPPP